MTSFPSPAFLSSAPIPRGRSLTAAPGGPFPTPIQGNLKKVPGTWSRGPLPPILKVMIWVVGVCVRLTLWNPGLHAPSRRGAVRRPRAENPQPCPSETSRASPMPQFPRLGSGGAPKPCPGPTARELRALGGGGDWGTLALACLPPRLQGQKQEGPAQTSRASSPRPWTSRICDSEDARVPCVHRYGAASSRVSFPSSSPAPKPPVAPSDPGSRPSCCLPCEAPNLTAGPALQASSPERQPRALASECATQRQEIHWQCYATVPTIRLQNFLSPIQTGALSP